MHSLIPFVHGCGTHKLVQLSFAAFCQADAEGIPTNPAFYSLLAKESAEHGLHQDGLEFVAGMSLEKKAKMPLFQGACERYMQSVGEDVLRDPRLSRSERAHCLVKLIQFAQEESAPSSGLFFISSDNNQTLALTTQEIVKQKLGQWSQEGLFNRCDFSHMDVSDMDFSGVRLHDALFNATSNLTRVNFIGADLRGSWFDGASLVHTNLDGATLVKVKFQNMNLSHKNFSGQNLTGVHFFKVEMEQVNMSNACLNDTKFTSVDLRTAYLKGVTMERTELIHVNLSGQNVSLVNFIGATFSHVDWTSVVVNPAHFKDIKFEGTRPENM